MNININTVLKFPDGQKQVLEGIIYEPKGIMQTMFGAFDKYEIVDAISHPEGKIKRFIIMENKCKPIM